MLRQKENIENYLSSAVFIALFFIFICAFAKNNDPPVTRYSHYKTVSENRVCAIAINDAQQISWQKSTVRLLENEDFKLLSDCNKIIENNKSVYIRLLSLQKTELIIKPALQQRFWFRYHSFDTSDFPDLS